MTTRPKPESAKMKLTDHHVHGLMAVRGMLKRVPCDGEEEAKKLVGACAFLDEFLMMLAQEQRTVPTVE